MSRIDDLLNDVLNNGGDTCTCKNTTRDKSVEYVDKTGKLLFYLDKNCPIHGIGRTFKTRDQQQPGRA